jgi:hypothetical protein
VRREHEKLLIDWAGAGLGLLRATVAAEALHLFAGFGLSAWLLVGYVSRSGESGGLLLFAYWVLNLPLLGQEVGLVARQYPGFRNATLRMLEPLGALEEADTFETTEVREEINAPAASATNENAALAETVTRIETAGPPTKVDGETQAGLVVAEVSGVLGSTAAPAGGGSNGDGRAPHAAQRGLSVVFEGVTVRAAGHTILEGIDLDVAASRAGRGSV